MSHAKEVAKALSTLLEKKLLLHRKHSDEISIWHGADVDLRGRLDEERLRLAPGFDLLEFIGREAPPPTWRPVRHNSETGVRRFFSAAYETLYSLDRYFSLDLATSVVPTSEDGRVVYVIPSTESEAQQTHELLRTKLRDPQIVFAVPTDPTSLQGAALELHCLLTMKQDPVLLMMDPLVEAELNQMIDDARGHLDGIMSRATIPGPLGPDWYYRGVVWNVTSRAQLLRELSGVMDGVFSCTPTIHNEMIVRKKPSAVVVNARKKLVLGILERTASETLGITGNFPDSSMYRSVLLNTGLHREDTDGGAWRFASPSELEDDNLASVWAQLRSFVSEPSRRPKAPSHLIETLTAPPIGLRGGLIPILLTSALRAFPSCFSVTRNGEYVDDILPSTIEDICRNPAEYRFHVVPLSREQEERLDDLLRFFAPDSTSSAPADRARLLYDGVIAWRTDLPHAARSTRCLSEPTAIFRDLVLRFSDPVRFVTEELAALGGPDQIPHLIESAKLELEGITASYEKQARRCVMDTLRLASTPQDADLVQVVKGWTQCFPASLVEELPEGVGRGLLRQMTTAFTSDRVLIDRIAGLILGRPLARWDDATPATFAKRLQSLVKELEAFALSGTTSGSVNEAASSATRELALSRLQRLVHQTRVVLGDDRLYELLLTIADELKGTARAHGK